MGTLVHLHDPFSPMARRVYSLAKKTTVRRLVQRHKGLRRHTHVFRPGGVYGRRQVREFSRPTVCFLNGVALKRDQWKRAEVGPKDVVTFYAAPLGGGGGGGGGGSGAVIGIVLALAIVVAAPYIGGLLGPVLAETFAIGVSTATSIATGVVGLGLGLVAYGVMSLFSTPPPPNNAAQTGYAGATPASSPTYNLTAQGNEGRIGQPIPELFGRNRSFPDFVTTPYADYVDNEQYLHHIMAIGIGEYEIDEDSIKLGDTAITSYGTDAVQWSVILPGDLSDTDLVDERYLQSRDVADIELLDAAESSPWAGPYVCSPPNTITNKMQIDTGAPRGLYKFNSGTGGLDAMSVTFEVQVQAIDDQGVPLGDPDTWTAFDPTTITKTATSQDPVRWTDELVLPGAGRWQMRVRRTDTKDTSLQAGHELHLIGLKGKLLSRRTFTGVTCIALKMKASAGLTSAQSRAFNCVSTRKLPTFDLEAGTMGTDLVATRDPCDAFAYIARSSNGARLSDDQIDLAGLYANRADFAAMSPSAWTFDFVYDQTITQSEALARPCRAVVAERVTQGGKLRLVRDVPVAAPVAMFSPRNILPGTLDLQYAMVDNTTADALIGTYIDQRTFQPVDVTVAFDDSAQERPSRMTLYGVGNRDQARAVLWNLARGNRYRRRTVGWQSPMEGLAVLFGDGISFSHDVPNWGQTLEVTAYDAASGIFVVSDPPDFSDSTATYYAAVRTSAGQKAGPFTVQPVDGHDDRITLDADDTLPEILTGGDKERTWLQFGPGEAYAKPLKVKQVTPRDEQTAEILAFDDDPRMYDPLPDDPEVPIGLPTDPITIHVDEDATGINLRTLANLNDYVGVVAQQVTIIIDPGVDAGPIVRGTWPSGYVPILVNQGFISGAAGAGGPPSTSGSPGGTALDTSSGALSLDNSAGTIRGGGGGGGGGGTAIYDLGDGGATFSLSGGSGGHGRSSSGAQAAGTAGETNTSIDPPPTGGTGGTGGDWGTAGVTGAAGDTLFTGGALPGGPGGAAGKAVVGLANIAFTGAHGTITGPTS